MTAAPTIEHALTQLYMKPPGPFANRSETKGLSNSECYLRPKLKRIRRSQVLTTVLDNLYSIVSHRPVPENFREDILGWRSQRRRFEQQQTVREQRGQDLWVPCENEKAARTLFYLQFLHPIMELVNASAPDSCSVDHERVTWHDDTAIGGSLPDWTLACDSNSAGMPVEFKRDDVLTGDEKLVQFMDAPFTHPPYPHAGIPPTVRMITQCWAQMVTRDMPLAILCNGKEVWFLHREWKSSGTLFISWPEHLLYKGIHRIFAIVLVALHTEGIHHALLCEHTEEDKDEDEDENESENENEASDHSTWKHLLSAIGVPGLDEREYSAWANRELSQDEEEDEEEPGDDTNGEYGPRKGPGDGGSDSQGGRRGRGRDRDDHGGREDQRRKSTRNNA
ncbi:hypothetical protein K439DRAFT_1656622, partial [Ramaria rubella]